MTAAAMLRDGRAPARTGDNGAVQERRRLGLAAVALLVVAVATSACDTADPFASVGSSPSAVPTGSVAASTSSSAGPTVATRSPAASVRPSAVPKPVASVKGTGFTDSKTFKLGAGNYVVRWTVTSKDPVGCTVIGALHAPDGKVSRDVVSATLAGKGTKSGAKTITKLPTGTYLVTFATTCAWTAQVYPS